MHRNHKDSNQMKKQNMFRMKKNEIKLQKKINKTEISHLPDKEFKVAVIKMLTELGRRMDE